jgi:hypothetical protein
MATKTKTVTEKEMRDAIQYAEGQLRGGSAIAAIPQENAARAYRRLNDLVERFDAQ